MNLAIALTAARHGATIANHVSVTKLHKTEGKLSGARVKVSCFHILHSQRNLVILTVVRKH